MILQFGTLILIAGLVVYIIFLHTRLTKKNIFIESTVKKLSGIDKSRSMEEMVAFMKELQKISQFSEYFTDKLLDESSVNFIFGNGKEAKTYIHYTKEENVATRILKEGFKFVDSFYKTALPVSGDKLDITVKHNSRKYYGDYLIVISISTDIVNHYSQELKEAGIKNCSFENILTETPQVITENADIEYLLPNKFIKGYVNHRTGEITQNPEFDPFYNSPAFMRNIDIRKKK